MAKWPIVDIIIPTWNNPQFFNPCLESISKSGVLNTIGRVIVVNNGQQPIKEMVGDDKRVLVLKPKENLGWERGLEYGLKHSEAPFVCFQNDDTQLIKPCYQFYDRLLMPFADRNVGAVGPITTIAAGWHSIYNPSSPYFMPQEVSFLIFFTVMLRREYLEKVGGIDTTAPGGDDLDLSIRLRDAGHKLIVNPDAFLIHHAFKTGERVRGTFDKVGGWNSQDMIERTNHWLIRKHGFKKFFQTMIGLDYSVNKAEKLVDLEGEMVRSFVQGKDVVELGCGAKKTVDYALGVDRVSNGDPIPHLQGGTSVADVVADVSEVLPFEDQSKDTVIARHILEHCLDPIVTLKNWNRVLKMGGRLVIAVPDEDVTSGVPMNAEHVHAFSKRSLRSFMEVAGFREVISGATGNGISFVACYEKITHWPTEIEALGEVVANA